MNWYYAKDGQQLGPVDEMELARLVASGAIVGTTLVWREGLTQWQPYQEVWVVGMPDWRSATSAVQSSSVGPTAPAAPAVLTSESSSVCSECRQSFAPDQLIQIGGRPVCLGCKPVVLQRLQEGVAPPVSGTGMPFMDPDTLVRCSAERRDQLEVMACLNRSWDLFKREPLLTIGSVVIAFLLIFAGGMVPFLSVCIGLLINTPLIAGVWFLFIKALRADPVSFEAVFSGFSQKWLPLVGVGILQGVVVLVCVSPFVAVAVFAAWIPSQRGVTLAGGEIVLLSVAGLLAMLVAMYLNLALGFSVPLMVDRGYGILDSLNTSRRIVNRHFLPLLLLGIMTFLVLLGGFLAICVGLFVAAPVAMGMWAAAYEEICGSRVSPS